MSDNIASYGGFGAQDPNAAFIQGAGALSSSGQAGVGGVDLQGKSTIEKSEMDAITMLVASGLPLLAPPQNIGNSQALSPSGISAIGNITVTQFAMATEQTKNDIISSMWDSFQKNVRELAERSKQEDIKKWTEDINRNGPKSAAEYNAYLMALSSTQRADEINGNGNALATQFNQTFNQWMVSPVQGSAKVDPTDPTGYPSSAFIAGSMAAHTDALHTLAAAGGAAGSQIGSVSPVSDAVFAVGPASALPMDYQAGAALVAALLNGGAVYKAATDSIAQATGAGQPVRDLDFALNYAKNIMNIVTHNVEGDEPLSSEQKTQNNMIRLTLTAMAMVLVYRTAYGGITAQEFASMLNPQSSKGLPDQIRPQIEQLAAILKNYLPTDSDARIDVLTRLMAYADKNESVDSMLSTTRIFSGMLNTQDVDNKRFTAGKG
jgi:hypothetical protein